MEKVRNVALDIIDLIGKAVLIYKAIKSLVNRKSKAHNVNRIK
uniref:Uncharacterized protein n=1 Tax=Chlamydiamicrovirus sp. TaxID=2832664 RepID=A0AB39A392_9VIRU